jgi:hypothetical protein
MRLRLVNKHFNNIINPPTHTTLLRLEHTAFVKRHRIYVCRHCIRLRPHTHFADAMITRKRSHAAVDAEKRFCADCGFAPSSSQQGYSPGTEVVVDGVRWVWCTCCRKVKKGVDAGEGRCHKACRACFEREGCRCLDSCFKHKGLSRRAEGGLVAVSVSNFHALWCDDSDSEGWTDWEDDSDDDWGEFL